MQQRISVEIAMKIGAAPVMMSGATHEVRAGRRTQAMMHAATAAGRRTRAVTMKDIYQINFVRIALVL